MRDVKIRNARRWADGGARSYAVAVAALAVASAIRFVLHPVLEANLPFMTFTVAALLVEFFCGLAPALFVVTGGLLIGTYYFVPPYKTLLIPEVWDSIFVGGYLVIVLLGVVLIESLQRSRYEARLLREVAQSRLDMLERSQRDRKSAEDATRQSERRYIALASNLAQVSYMRRLDGHFEYVNDRFYELTGLAPGCLEESGWLDTIHPDDAGRVRAALQHVAETGTEQQCGFRIRMADGCYGYFAGQMTRAEDKLGKIIKWTGTLDQSRVA